MIRTRTTTKTIRNPEGKVVKIIEWFTTFERHSTGIKTRRTVKKEYTPQQYEEYKKSLLLTKPTPTGNPILDAINIIAPNLL